MRLPRDLSGQELAHAFERLGYQVTRQTVSHMRLTTQQNGEHHITIPRHRALTIGVLSAILGEVAAHAHLTRGELVGRLFPP